MKTSAVIAARMGSSRLPGKALLPILGKPMLERMIERVRHSRHIGQIVIATTELAEDDVLASFAASVGVECFRGSADDVLGRMAAAAAACDVSVVVELLGDNPLVHADLIDDVIEFYHAQGVDYAASVTTEYPRAGSAVRKFPVGVRVQIFRAEVLARCAELAHRPADREHVTTFIYSHPEIFKLGYFEASGTWAPLNRPDLTFAVNYGENLDMIRRIFERCYPVASNFSLLEAIRAFEADPALRALMGTPAGSGGRP